MEAINNKIQHNAENIEKINTVDVENCRTTTITTAATIKQNNKNQQLDWELTEKNNAELLKFATETATTQGNCYNNQDLSTNILSSFAQNTVIDNNNPSEENSDKDNINEIINNNKNNHNNNINHIITTTNNIENHETEHFPSNNNNNKHNNDDNGDDDDDVEEEENDGDDVEDHVNKDEGDNCLNNQNNDNDNMVQEERTIKVTNNLLVSLNNKTLTNSSNNNNATSDDYCDSAYSSEIKYNSPKRHDDNDDEIVNETEKLNNIADVVVKAEKTTPSTTPSTISALNYNEITTTTRTTSSIINCQTPPADLFENFYNDNETLKTLKNIQNNEEEIFNNKLKVNRETDCGLEEFGTNSIQINNNNNNSNNNDDHNNDCHGDEDEDDGNDNNDQHVDNDETSLLNIVEDNNHYSNESQENEAENEEKEQMEQENAEAQVPVDMEHDESMRSRCSSVSSSASSTSSTSSNSSLNHLVIDQPPILGSFIEAKNELPINLKRKTSQTSLSDTEAADAKRAHLDLNDDNTEEKLNEEEEEEHQLQPSLSQSLPSESPAHSSPSTTKITTIEIPPPNSRALSCHEHKINLLNSNVAALLNEVRNNQVPNAFHNNFTHGDEETHEAIGTPSPILQNGLTFDDEPSPIYSPIIKSILTPKTTSTTNTVIETENSNIKTPTTATSEESEKKEKTHYFKCSSCQTCHEGWNFFLHIFEKHKRFLCLYCIRVFPTAEKLSLHLEIKHDLEQNHYNSEDALLQHLATAQNSSGTSSSIEDASVYDLWNSSLRFLMCCTCQHIFMGNQPYSNHECNTYMQPCSLCGQKGRHTNNCKAHPDASKRNKLIHVNNLQHKVSSMDDRATNNNNNITLQQKTPQQQSEVYNIPATTTTNCDSENTTATTTSTLIPDITTNTTASMSELMCEFNNSLSHNNQQHNIDYDFVENTTTRRNENEYNTNFHEEEQQQAMAGNMNTIATDDYEMDVEKQEDGEGEKEQYDEEEENGTPKLVVPKFKLRVPKEFQKSVDAAITSSEESENEDDSNTDEEAEEEEEDLLQQSKEEISQDEQETEAQKSVGNESEPLDISLEENHESTEDISSKLSPPAAPTITDNDQKNSQIAVGPKLPEENENEMAELPTNGPSEEWTPTPPASPSIKYHETTKEPTNTIPMEPLNEATLTETAAEAEEKEDLTNNDTDTSINIDGSVDISLLSGQLNVYENLAVPPPILMEEPTVTAVTEVPNVIDSPKIDVEDNNDDTLAIVMQLDSKLENLDFVQFLRICLSYSSPLCLYCNHARRIAVNARYLLLHIIEHHRFTATITASTTTGEHVEELKSNIIMEKLKSFLPQLETETRYINGMHYNKIMKNNNVKEMDMDNDKPKEMTIVYLEKTDDERIYECFMCRFVTKTHKELYLHNRKMHLRSAVLCFMCRGHFQNFSEVLCHMCPGVQHKVSPLELKFRCCLCNFDEIPSSFRLMVHLRKIHYSCDVCLENCYDQLRLSSHVWKHKQRHMCHRCGIAYRNKLDIQKHLFWKHGTESTVCKYCLQKRWRHVYHFCVPPAQFVCTICNMCFSKAVYLMVHLREHEGNLPYTCEVENCLEKFVSRRLLRKHADSAHDRDVQEMVDNAQEAPAKEGELAQIKTDEATITKVEGTGQSEDQLTSAEDKAKEHVEKAKNIVDDESENKAEVVEKVAANETKEEKEQDGQAKTKTVEDMDLVNKKVDTFELRADSNEDKTTEKDSEVKKAENVEKHVDEVKKHKKQKKKRKKHTLDFLNLRAPNLSESDSSTESDSNEDDADDVKSRTSAQNNKDEQKSVVAKDATPMENINFDISDNAGKTLKMWKHLLEAQGTPLDAKFETDLEYTEENYPQPKNLHVAFSDHDYCLILTPPDQRKKNKKLRDKEEKQAATVTDHAAANIDSTAQGNENSPKKRQRLSSRMSDISFSSSSDSSSTSSSHTCDSNCSCSDSSDSSSSNSDSSESDSSNNSTRSVSNGRKKLLSKSKESSKSPHKKLSKHNKHHKNNNNNISNDNNNNNNNIEEPMDIEEPEPEQPALPLFIESDLATEQSDSGEDYYDQHPQKVANELLLQQRAQVMGQTQFVPSSNEQVAINENNSTAATVNELISSPEKTKKKLKRKKRDKRNNNNNATKQQQQHTFMENATHDLPSIYNNKSNVQTDNVSHYGTLYNNNHNNSEQFAMPMEQNAMSACHHGHAPMEAQVAHNNYSHLSMEPVAAYKLFSDGGGSSSEADNSLKRSKRQRRPNKFYGYTSDDESMSSNLGQSLLIGTRTFKPQPPPQLTWNKDDLPTPSKSILNNSKVNKTNYSSNATARSNLDGAFSEFADLIAQDSHRRTFGIAAGGKVGSGAFYKRAAKKANKSRKVSSAEEENTTLPPIPRLKIKPSKLGLNVANLHPLAEETSKTMQKSSRNVVEKYNSSSALSSSEDESTPRITQLYNTPTVSNSLQHSALPVGPVLSANALLLPQSLPAAPVPKAMAFNRKIPPALLPNPDFTTLQYFKAHNIRYPIRPPAGARQAREGESVYCYCRCPYDEVSEMIACDGEECIIEWFHFECVGIMMAPLGKWYCAECRGKLIPPDVQ